MKQFKKLLAVVLALVMILSCAGAAFAADKTDVSGQKIRGDAADREKNAKGYKSDTFLRMNSYRYADDELVRAIVVLEGTPEADVAERNSERAVSHRAKLMSEHQKIRSAMSGIDYTLLYDYTALLDGFACEVAYGDLDKIAAIEGVKAVHIANHYAVPAVETAKDVKMAYANLMTGNTASVYAGYNGSGMVVAVLDTGLRVTHEAFKVYEGVDLTETLTAEDVSKAGAEGKYVSAKVPFAYDYADMDNDVADHDGHGTHVAGTIGGLVIDTDGAVTFEGGAPMAQILAMKVFSDEGEGTSSDIYFYALEDAYKLGADVINMSLGAQNGFTFDTELETEEFGNIYERLENAGIVACISAGNDYSMAENSTMGYIGPEYQDYGTVGSPATYEGNTSIASVENLAYPSYTIDIGEDHVPYTDSSEDAMWRAAFSGKDPVGYVVVPSADDSEMISFGYAKDFEATDVSGKIAVIQRGDISFEEKVENAANAGAIGCIVINNQAGVISMAIETFEIPAVSVPQNSVEVFLSDNQLTVSNELNIVENPLACQMSDFSSWGTTPDLTIDPAITSVGGNVYSSVNTADDAYEVYSGTSMACPNAAATFANVLQALKEKGVTDKAARAEQARNLLESSAYVFTDLDGYLYSVRKQGAGLVNSAAAIDLLENGAYITNPLQELGDDAEKTGKYGFEVELKNDTDKDVEYFYGGVAMYDYIYDANYDPDADEESAKEPLYVNSLTSDYLKAGISVDGLSAATCYNKQFKDCADDAWYHEYVDYVCYAGLMNGTGTNKFEPDTSMTRAMAVTVLYRMAGAPEGYAPATFKDVPANEWYSDAIAWAQAEGVVNGTSATTFSPNDKITREQLATILWRNVDEPDADTAYLDDFVDGAKVSEYAKIAMAWAVEYGILNGDNGKLLPTNNATRAQYAAIITRFVGGYYDCNGGVIVVPANSTKKCNVTITLDEDAKAYLDAMFEYGAYVEGYIEFYNNKNATHATYLAYYGDWTEAPVLEAADFRDLIKADIFANTVPINDDGNTYADAGYSGLDMIDCYTMPNMAYTAVMSYGMPEDLVWYLGNNLFDYVDFNEKHISFSTDASNAQSVYANGIYMEPYQLRNCDHLIMTITDAETNEVYYVDDTSYLPKAYYDNEYGWSASGSFFWDGTDKDGNYVPSGTIAHVNFDAILPYRDTKVENVWSYDVMVDYTAPVIDSVVYDETAKTLTVTAHDDNYLQAIALYGCDGQMLDVYSFSSDKPGESFTATFDLTKVIEYGHEHVYEHVYVSAIDYATNETIDGNDAPYYYVPDTYSDSFAGEYVIGGFPYDTASKDYLYDAPVLLKSDGTELDSATTCEVVAGLADFSTYRTDLTYTFTEVEEYVYTIQNANGKYLAAVDGKIAFVDTADKTAQWIVVTDALGYAYIFNLANDDLTLLFDDEAGEFAIFDDSQAIGTDEDGEPYYPSDYYYIWLFAREATGGFVPNYIDIVEAER